MATGHKAELLKRAHTQRGKLSWGLNSAAVSVHPDTSASADTSASSDTQSVTSIQSNLCEGGKQSA